jgi:enterochelin esterase family protein
LAASLAQGAITPDAFWAGLPHAPLIDEIPGKPGEARYTFLWRSPPGAHAAGVSLASYFPQAGGGWLDPLKRIGETNVWYASYVLPRDARIAYAFAAPRGVTPSSQANAQVEIDGAAYEVLRDPLNPTATDEDTAIVSYAEGPAARSTPFLQANANAPSGSVATMPFASKALGVDRTVTIYTPPGFREGESGLPVVLLFDGRQYTTASVPTPLILDNMIAAGAVPRVIAVFVHTPQETRNQDLGPDNPSFRTFITGELMPWVRKRYRASSDPAKTVIGGSSLGGFAAAHLALLHPDIFGNVISLSASYWLGAESVARQWLVAQYRQSPRLPIRFYQTIGLWDGELGLQPNRDMRAVLDAKGYRVTYREFAGGHDYSNWRQALPEALAAVLR